MRLGWALILVACRIGAGPPAPTDKGAVFDALRRGVILEPPFDEGTDDRWLAEQLVRWGPEPLWPADVLQQRLQRAREHGWAPETAPIVATLTTSGGGRPIEAELFLGSGGARLMILGGVHGSEASGIEVVQILRGSLRQDPPQDTVLLLPVLFPDQAEERIREDPGRPTNRNFPAPGRGAGSGLDAQARPILRENRALIERIARFQPERIASVHATWRREAAGVFSDPHTTGAGATDAATAQAQARSDADEALALAMAEAIAAGGHHSAVLGNALEHDPHAGWSGTVEGGVSLGRWAPRAVHTDGIERPAVGVITVEVAGYHRSDDPEAGPDRRAELEAYADAIEAVFLGAGGHPR